MNVFSKEELFAIQDLIQTMDDTDKVLRHPVSTLEFMRMFAPELEFVRELYPWIEEHEGQGLRLSDIVKELLLSRGVCPEKIDEAIDAIRNM